MVYLSPYVTNKLFLRNPWITLWWSAAFPGCGHIMLCKYFTGYMLIGWEFFININAHVNQAIFYSMIGKFDLAKSVLDTRWFLLYIGVYVFAMWDCFSLTIDLNKFYLLADREDASIMPFNMGALELNYLDNRDPWNGTIWSFITPGIGYLYINRLPSGFLVLIWFVVVTYFSRLLPAIHATSIGDYHRAAALLDPEWFLFLPSIILFTAHDVYLQTIGSNKLFKMEQSRFFADHYQAPNFRLPFGIKR
jgi:hypothetical protein